MRSASSELVAGAVTALFVPGDRPDRYAKAAAAGADVVIVDLEDAVAPAAKAAAREAVAAALADGLRALVRVNALGSAAADEDVAALVGVGPGLLGVVVPKAEDAAALRGLAGRLDGLALVALVESARGVARAYELAVVPGVTRLAFGALDLALDVGSRPDAATGGYARAQVVIASRAADLVGPLESPAVELRDVEAIEATTRAAADLGFTGRLCVHPAQLAAVRAGFVPSAEDVAWAESVVGAGDAAVQVDGRMVDRPMIERARALLARAARAG